MLRQYARAGGTVLIIEQTPEGFFLYSFPKDGLEGDSWHQSAKDARDQAERQFCATEWADVPSDVTNLRAYARQISN